ncbi:MAG: hypothetical protein R2932_51250 [Caldilineaceae bacterium]
MTVQTVGSNGPVNITVRSPSGVTWNGAPQAGAGNVANLAVAVAEAGDYTVTLNAPAGATPYQVTFALGVASTAVMPTPVVALEQVVLAPGTTTERTAQLLDGAVPNSMCSLARRDRQ